MFHWACLSQTTIAAACVTCKAIHSPHMQPKAASLLCGCPSPYRPLYTQTPTTSFPLRAHLQQPLLLAVTNECDEQPASQLASPLSSLTPNITPSILLYLPTYPPTHLPTYPPTHLPTYSPTHLLTYSPAHPPSNPATQLSTHLPTYLPTYQVHTYVYTYLPNLYSKATFEQRLCIGMRAHSSTVHIAMCSA